MSFRPIAIALYIPPTYSTFVHTVRGDGKAAEQFIIFPHGFRPALDRCVAGFQQNTMSSLASHKIGVKKVGGMGEHW